MINWPRSYWTNLNGPVPIGAVLAGFSRTFVPSKTWRGRDVAEIAQGAQRRFSGIGRE